jgi:circadian clock protein KaiB
VIGRNDEPPSDRAVYVFELFVVGRTARAEVALQHLRAVCAKFLRDRHEIRVVDVLEDPVAAERANVVATPTLIRRSPPPERRLVGDLSVTETVLNGLGIERGTPAEET